MKGNKIIAVLVVLAMVLSTLMVLNTVFDIKFVEKASAVPGVTTYGYPTNVTTYGLVYDPDTTVDIDINTTGLTASTNYYLYYPVYNLTGSTYNLTWKPYKVGGVQKKITVGTPGTDKTLEDITLDKSGLWILNKTELLATINCHNASTFSETVAKWFWVNTSPDYTLEITYTGDLNYGENKSIKLTATSGTSSAPAWFDIRRDSNGEPEITDFPTYEDDGTVTFSSDWVSALQWTGNYSVSAYRDLDGAQPLYSTLGYGYNDTFGSSPAITADYYNYTLCGPWDPPEVNATKGTIYVKPGEPTTEIPTANQTMYWNFYGEVNISVKGYDGKNLSDGLQVKVFNPDDEDVTANLTIDNTTVEKGYIHISNDTWGVDDGAGGKYVFGGNGTWYAYLYNNTDIDSGAAVYTEEWNATVEWTVKKAPGVQFRWINDDGGSSSSGTANDGVIEAVPAVGGYGPLNISFQLVSATHTYYGDDAPAGQAPALYGENITISGDALFTGTLDKIPGVHYISNTWHIELVPLMDTNGGEITISASWTGEGSISETLTVGGSKLNGSIVTISPTQFIIDQNVTITVKVTGPTGYPYPNANVYLYWLNDTGGPQGLLNQTSGGGTTSGEYTFRLNRSQQTTNQTAAGNPWSGGTILAPRNITAAANTPTVGWGYAKAKMIPQSDLKVSVSQTTIMAGKRTRFHINVTTVDSVGNNTGYPASGEGLQVALYNSTGDRVDVTTIGTLVNGDLDAVNNSIYETLLVAGTYTVYVSNNTHDSIGHNATLIVKAVDVTCDKEELIWQHDENISAIFTVMYDGELINGTLTLYNVTDVGDYNRTWANESDTGNDSIDLDIVNGVATLSNITAEFLPGSTSQKNITYMFEPETLGTSAKANGMLPVKIPTVTPSPRIIPFDKKTTVKIKVTGRGTSLEGVFVSIFVPGLTEQNGSTNSLGEKDFAFTPPQTGNVIIKIENRTSKTKIRVTAWALYVDAPTSADEAESFVVTVRNETSTGDLIEGATITFNGETYTTGSDGTATVDSPDDIAVDSDFTVTASKEGYAPATDTIKIINKPKLEITIDQTPDTNGKYSSPVDVYVSDDDGNLITAATVTFGTQALTTVNGKVTITVDTETTGTIGATKTGFTAADGVTVTIKAAGIPGFELLTLIAAIGVAFILLRRRRH